MNQMHQAAQLGYYPQTTPTVDQAIQRLRARASELRSNINSVEAWRAELAKVEAMLATWGDK